MRYNRAERLIQLALEMQAARGGLTITDIMERFDVSRRTAIRMRDAVIRAFPQADEVPSNDRTKRWRLGQGSAQALAGITADDLATLEAAAKAFDQANLETHAEHLRTLSAKVRGALKDPEIRQIDPDLEALLEAEGLAHRPGPRPLIPMALFETLREAIKSCRKVSFDYASRTGGGKTRRIVSPLGFLYGHRHYLVAQDGAAKGVRSFSLPAMSALRLEPESFERPADFNLKDFVARCFGVFDEPPADIVWKFTPEAAPLARQFVFHHSQKLEPQADGSLIVRFHAGGQLEMAWHLVSWGRHVEVVAPESLKALMPANPTDWPALP
ncbi:MAG: helix-turn-helix transcriptional regulator [Chakrabartia sp.]